MTKDRRKYKNTFGIIYKATNRINGKIYIGQTQYTLKKRKGEHISAANRQSINKTYFIKAISKYGGQGFVWEEIDSATNREELNEKEKYWIDYYNSYGDGGYNLTLGGEGATGREVTEEERAKRSDFMTEQWKSGLIFSTIKGEQHPLSILTNKDVFQIRDMIIEGKKTSVEISEIFNIAKSTLEGIKKGRAWKHLITTEDLKRMNPVEPKSIKNIKSDDVLELKRLLLETEIEIEEIYEMFNISYRMVATVLRDEKWSHIFTKDEIKKIKNRKGMGKLTEAEAIEIKILLLQKEISQNEIAEMYGITKSAISKIKSGRNWGSLQIPNNYN